MQHQSTCLTKQHNWDQLYMSDQKLDAEICKPKLALWFSNVASTMLSCSSNRGTVRVRICFLTGFPLTELSIKLSSESKTSSE
jgi:hypothetical protein